MSLIQAYTTTEEFTEFLFIHNLFKKPYEKQNGDFDIEDLNRKDAGQFVTIRSFEDIIQHKMTAYHFQAVIITLCRLLKTPPVLITPPI